MDFDDEEDVVDDRIEKIYARGQNRPWARLTLGKEIGEDGVLRLKPDAAAGSSLGGGTTTVGGSSSSTAPAEDVGAGAGA